MDQLSPTPADDALRELHEVSPQVEASLVLTRESGAIDAFAPALSGSKPARLGAACRRLLEQAEQSRSELGREPVTQVEVATGDGHVFVVADTHRVVAAVTDADPTVGLVFYDLKTALRSIRESASGQPEAGETS